MRSVMLGMMAAAALGAPAFGQGVNDLPACSGPGGVALASQLVRSPAVGAEGEAEIGQSMISALKVQAMARGVGTAGEVVAMGVYAGQPYEVRIPAGVQRELSEGQAGTVKIAGATFRYEREKAPRRGLSAPYIDIVPNSRGAHSATIVLSFGMSSERLDVEDPAIRARVCAASDGPGFRRELVYSGVSKGTVRLLYREFINDMARPAFSQDLTYDLADGDEIGYRGARFKILKATNVSIQYVVLRPLQD